MPVNRRSHRGEPNVTVLGAGIIGLTTALELSIRGYHVRVLAENFSPSTNSDTACAIFLPTFAYSAEATKEVEYIVRWARESWQKYTDLVGKIDGVAYATGIELFGVEADIPSYCQDIFPGSRVVFRDDLPSGYKWVWEFRTLIIEMPKYMPWLMAQCAQSNIPMENEVFSSWEQVKSLDADFVINCLGLGAKKVVPDRDLRSVRGQLILFPAVRSRLAIGGGVFCVYPRSDALVVGSLWIEDDDAKIPDAASYNELLASLEYWKRNILPQFGFPCDDIDAATAILTVTGLRPFRRKIRVEVDEDQRVIHNYGHGGIGVSLSWGCAKEVAELLARTVAGS